MPDESVRERPTPPQIAVTTPTRRPRSTPFGGEGGKGLRVAAVREDPHPGSKNRARASVLIERQAAPADRVRADVEPEAIMCPFHRV